VLVVVGWATTSDRKSWFEATEKKLKPELMSGQHSVESGSYENHLKTAGFLRPTLSTFWMERGDSNYHNATCHTFDDKPGL
jgi:hypothetical protein